MEKKYAVQGIIGCVLFGIGDWLLGFVDPGEIKGDVFYFLSAGHGAGYPSWKIKVTLALAVIGVLFLQQGFVHISDLMKAEKDKAGAERVFTFLTYAWLVIHFAVTIIVFVYSYTARTVTSEKAVSISNALDKVFDPCILIAYLIVAISLTDLVVVIARGRTVLKRTDAFFTPMTWMALIGVISMILPSSPFSKGLYAFCMNGGMIIWFITLLLNKHPNSR
ncbi:MAG: hypothetical protein K5921_12245 [Lachnospiraceae bacterium]|nr:hypothetical protein [Lachnospiraceae bacterium]